MWLRVYPSLAGPAEILVSRELAHLAGKLDGVKYVERGPIRLEDLTNGVDVINVRPELEDLAQDVAFRRALGPFAGRAVEALEAANPYKGLRAFEEADVADFFGRETLTERLVDGCADPLPRRCRPERQREVVRGAGRPRAGTAPGSVAGRRIGRSSRCSLVPIRSRSSRRPSPE